MESNVRQLPQARATAQHVLPDEFHADSGHVVDLFDAAALIESRGYSDRSLLSKYGYGSVFDLAGRLTASAPERPAAKAAAAEANPLNASWMRAGLLISGALLAALVQVQLGAGFLEMSVAGCAGWILGQAVAGVTWYRLRSDSRGGAARYGGVVAVVCAALAVVLACALALGGQLGAYGFSLVLGWVAYALSVSLLVVLDRVTVPLVVMALTVVIQLIVWLTASQVMGGTTPLTVLPALAAVAVIVGYTVYTVSSGEPDGERELTGYRGIAVPVTQAVLLSGALVTALALVPHSHGTAFVATAVLAVACTDPGIVALRRRLSWFAHRSSSLSWSRRFAWGLASLAVLAIAALAAGLVVFIVKATAAAPEHLPVTVLGSVLFTVLATLSSVLTAFGAQLKGLVPAALALPVMLAVGTLAGGPALAVCALAFAVGLSLLIHEFSDARVFA